MGRHILRAALFISGGGTTAEAIIKANAAGTLPHLEIACVIASRKDAEGSKKAKKWGVRTRIVDPRNFKTQEEFGEALLALLKKLNIELISQNGWLPLTPPKVVKVYQNRLINQHPGPLDPGRDDFGGKGMYGARVTCARIIFALLSGRANLWTEATTHWVTNKYDQGKLLQTRLLKLGPLPYIVTKDIETHAQDIIQMTKKVQSELLPLEHTNVIATLQLFKKGTPAGFTRKSPLVAQKNLKDLETAKRWAIRLFPHG